MPEDQARLTRVLFVDDEQRVLDGLRHGLRGRRKQWDMVFVASGSAALEHLATGPFDVVVSDMRMPRMDGAELLARVSNLHPQTVRIVLSGHMDEGAASRAAQVAHRFLAKPCDISLLDMTIARTLEMRHILAAPAIRACIGGMGTLPSPPKTCMALHRALEDDAPVKQVADIVETDVAMASKVLQLVNSSFFGVPRKLANVSQAVAYLGLNSLRNLVVAQSMFQSFEARDARRLERMQQRALLSARIARGLLPDKKQSELACTAALLHDVGILPFQARLADEYSLVRELAVSRRVCLEICEREFFATSHAEVGAYLLGLWGLPFEVIEAVAAHHSDLTDVSELDVNAAVAIAVSLASSLLLPPEEAPVYAAPLPPEVIERFNLGPKFEELADEFQSTGVHEKVVA